VVTRITEVILVEDMGKKTLLRTICTPGGLQLGVEGEGMTRVVVVVMAELVGVVMGKLVGVAMGQLVGVAMGLLLCMTMELATATVGLIMGKLGLIFIAILMRSLTYDATFVVRGYAPGSGGYASGY